MRFGKRTIGYEVRVIAYSDEGVSHHALLRVMARLSRILGGLLRLDQDQYQWVRIDPQHVFHAWSPSAGTSLGLATLLSAATAMPEPSAGRDR